MARDQAIELDGIRVGDRVTVHYVLDFGRNLAKSLTVGMSAT
jgi:hypothetical protein